MAMLEQSPTPGFALKWANFPENLMQHFGMLIEQENFVDVTLVCEGKQFRAHKVVLSASSPYLSNILKDNPCKHPVIILDNNITAVYLGAILSFIYTGEVHVPHSELEMFLNVARLLELRGIPEITSTLDTFQWTTTHKPREPIEPRETKMEAEISVPTMNRVLPSNNEVQHNPMEIKSTVNLEFLESTRQHLSHFPESETTSYVGSTNSRGTSIGTTTTATGAISTTGRSSGVGGGGRPHSLDPRPCPVCGNFYSNLSNLRQHLRLIHNPTHVKCNMCSRTFKTALYLRRHIMGFHEVTPSSDYGQNNFVQPTATNTPTTTTNT